MKSEHITAVLIPAAGFLGGLLITLLILVILPRLTAGEEKQEGVRELILIPAQVGPNYEVPTPESAESTKQPAAAPGRFVPGDEVRVNGTDGQGLRLREYPSLGSRMLHLADEGEEYVVLGGPVSADDYQWWFLEFNADSGRRGWGVEVFLERINE